MQPGSGAAAPPAMNRFAAPRRTGVRARYVDTMNSGGGGGAAGGGASVGLASLVPKPAFAPPAGEQREWVPLVNLTSSQANDDIDKYALFHIHKAGRGSHF